MNLHSINTMQLDRRKSKRSCSTQKRSVSRNKKHAIKQNLIDIIVIGDMNQDINTKEIREFYNKLRLKNIY